MMDILKQYVWETDRHGLNELMTDGYSIVYMDVNLSVIYGELLVCFNGNIEPQVKELFGYYGSHALRLVDGVYYWLMQV